VQEELGIAAQPRHEHQQVFLLECAGGEDDLLANLADHARADALADRFDRSAEGARAVQALDLEQRRAVDQEQPERALLHESAAELGEALAERGQRATSVQRDHALRSPVRPRLPTAPRESQPSRWRPAAAA
jgi:hypothetical protein